MTHAQRFFFDDSRWKFSETLISLHRNILLEFENIPRELWRASNSDYNNLDISQKSWYMFPFITKGIRHESNISLCPTISFLLETVPIYDNCIFSIISGGTKIPPHQGFCDHHYRVHLGLKTDGKSWIRVGDQVRYWKNKEILIFHDWDVHEVENPSQEERAVLLFDIEKKSYHDNII
jgi:aspartyl/asparaginyl beta-hydroxylase (cupin superfamily)